MKKFFFGAITLLSALSAHAQMPIRIADTFSDNGAGSREQYLMTVYNNKLHYFSDTGALVGPNQHWWHMLSYDGTNSISMIPETYKSWIDLSNIFGTTVQWNGKLYFSIRDAHIYPVRRKIAMFDGTNPIDVAPNQTLDTFINIDYLAAAGNNLYFNGTKGVTPVSELWYYGTSGSAKKITLVPGSAQGAAPTNMFVHAGKLYFGAKPDATPGNTAVLYELNPLNNSFHIVKTAAYPNGVQNPRQFASIDGKLYFTATDSSMYQMFSYDGTSVKKLTSSSYDALGPYCKYREEIYFQVLEQRLVKDTQYVYTYNVNTGLVAKSAAIHAAVRDARSTQMIVYKNKLYFTATNASGTELWRFDGQAATMVADINPGAGSMLSNSGWPWFTLFNNNLYFFATNGVSRELYRLYDPTGIQQHSWSGSVVAYPNPTSTSVILSISLQSPESLRIELTDLQGRRVWMSELTAFSSGKSEVSIPMQNLVPGQYFYRLSDEKGQMKASGSLMKQ